jgi:hypothetical protein
MKVSVLPSRGHRFYRSFPRSSVQKAAFDESFIVHILIFVRDQKICPDSDSFHSSRNSEALVSFNRCSSLRTINDDFITRSIVKVVEMSPDRFVDIEFMIDSGNNHHISGFVSFY